MCQFKTTMRRSRPDDHWVQIPTVNTHTFDSCDIGAIDTGPSVTFLVILADNYLGAFRQ